MAVNNYEIEITSYGYQVDVGGSSGLPANALAKSGAIAVQTGTDHASVSFTTNLQTPISDFTVLAWVYNSVDSFPQDLTVKLAPTGFSTSGLSFILNAPTDTGNYFIHWAVLPRSNG